MVFLKGSLTKEKEKERNLRNVQIGFLRIIMRNIRGFVNSSPQGNSTYPSFRNQKIKKKKKREIKKHEKGKGKNFFLTGRENVLKLITNENSKILD